MDDDQEEQKVRSNLCTTCSKTAFAVRQRFGEEVSSGGYTCAQPTDVSVCSGSISWAQSTGSVVIEPTLLVLARLPLTAECSMSSMPRSTDDAHAWCEKTDEGDIGQQQ